MNSTDATTLYQDARIYDQIHTKITGPDFDFYTNLVEPGQEVLELACGTGRLTIPMAQMGLCMTGLDLSPEMLAEAERKADASAVEVEWIHGNAADFNLGRKFDLIFMTCNSIQHLHHNHEVRGLLNTVHAHLKSGGTFALDLFRPDLRLLTRDPEVRTPVVRYLNDDQQVITVEETHAYDEIHQINRIQWFHSNEQGDLLKTDALEMRQFFPQEIDELLFRSGFRITAKYGSWDLQPMSNDNYKQILVLKLAGETKRP